MSARDLASRRRHRPPSRRSALPPADPPRRAKCARLDFARDRRRVAARLEARRAPALTASGVSIRSSTTDRRPLPPAVLRQRDRSDARTSLALLARFRARLRAGRGEASADGLVSLDFASCTGLCDHGAGLLVNEHRHSPAGPSGRSTRSSTSSRAERAVAQLAGGAARSRRQPPPARSPPAAPISPGRALDAAIALGRAGRARRNEALGPARARRRGFPHGAEMGGRPQRAGRGAIIVCNADEGEPGTFKDRVLLQAAGRARVRGHGHRRLRGRRAARPSLHARRIRISAAPWRPSRRHAREREAPGRRHRGAAGFDFDIEIYMGAGACLRRRNRR